MTLALEGTLREVRDAVLALQAQGTTGAATEATLQSAVDDLDILIASVATGAKQDTANAALAAILAKLIAAPATEGKQDTANTALAAILAKMLTAPSTEAKQDTANTSLAAILAKLIAAPSTEAKQDTANTSLAAIDADLPAVAALGDSDADASLSKIAARLQAYTGSVWAKVRMGFVGAISAVNLGLMLNVLSTARYNVTPPTLADGEGAILQLTSACNLRIAEQLAAAAEDNTNSVIHTHPRAVAVSTGGWSTYQTPTGGVGTAGVSIKGSAGRVRYAEFANSHTTIGYYACLVNKATAAVNGDQIMARVWIPPRGAALGDVNSGALFFGESGRVFSLGVSLCCSTDPKTVALIGTLDGNGSVDWI